MAEQVKLKYRIKHKSGKLTNDNGKEKYLKAFLLGFFAFMIIVTPIIIYNGGYYIYYGDYNSQQMPFYSHAHEYVKSEGLGWDWNTDLGANFVGSYSFYLLGSPFFWLTIPLPQSMVVPVMPVLLAVKFGLASMTAYAYIRRFVRNKNASLIGGMLYAFSGFQMFNIFFNHFHDVTAFFPLMLIAMEERVNNNRRGVFALTVALMGIINYFFFTGQAVFLVIYLLVRLKSPDFKITWKKFFSLAIEAVIGALIACVMLVPSALAILDNYRVNERLYGMNMVAYGDRTRILRIIQSFFMIPDVPARPNLFSSDGAKWASIGGYLPMFSMAGVIAFCRSRKKHWTKRLLLVCAVFAFIPILNSAFYTLNASYYARWYYMPVLIMALMTAQAFDDLTVDFRSGIKICAVVLTAFAVISVFPVKDDDGNVKWFQFAEYPAFLYVTILICLMGLAVLWYLNSQRLKEKHYHIETAVKATVIFCIVCTGAVEYFGAMHGQYNLTYIKNGIHGSEHIDLDEEENQFFRVDMAENYDNYPMFWELSSMRAFQSVVPGSIMEFYSGLDITRDVASRVPLENYALRGLLSVKYYFSTESPEEVELSEFEDNQDSDKKKVDIPGFEYVGLQNNFYLYENKYYVPMGFTYDNYVSQNMYEKYTNKTKERILMRAVVLDDEQIQKYSDIISELPAENSVGLNSEDYIQDCTERKKESCSSFIYDSDGFEAEIELEQSKLVFFSVPYESGWTAFVNGKPADVEKVSGGFMAVKAEKGENKIEFCYSTPGLKTGAYLTLCGFVFLALYLWVTRRYKNDGGFVHYYDYNDYNLRLHELYQQRMIYKDYNNAKK